MMYDNRQPLFAPTIQLPIQPGKKDVYGIDVAPLSVFENQVSPVNVTNLSKSFLPNLVTIRVFSLISMISEGNLILVHFL